LGESGRYGRLKIKNYTMLVHAIILFIIGFAIIHLWKPSIVYQPDGSLRTFGVGYRKKTVVPLWLVVFLLAIFSYTAAIYSVKV
jgi:hypothetical protein